MSTGPNSPSASATPPGFDAAPDKPPRRRSFPRRRLRILWRRVYDNSLAFAAGARAASDDDLSAFLHSTAAERRSLRRQIGRLLEPDGAQRAADHRDRRGSTWNIVRRVLLQLRGSLPRGDHAVVHRLEREQPALEALYEDALESTPKGSVRRTLEAHLRSIRQTRKRLQAVRAIVA